jgi:hypothetical protein
LDTPYGDRGNAGSVSREEIVTGRSPDADPPWLYYLTPGHIDCQGGYALILAGRARLADGDRTGRNLLRRGTVMLRTGAHDRPLGDSSQRRALYEGAWLGPRLRRPW